MNNYFRFISIMCVLLSVRETAAQMNRFQWSDFDVTGPVVYISSRMEAPGDTTRIFHPYNDWPCYENAEYQFDMDQGIVTYSYLEEGDLLTNRMQQYDQEGFNVHYTYQTNRGDFYEERIERFPNNRVKVKTFDSDTLKSEITYVCDSFYRFVSEEMIVKDASEPYEYHKRSYTTDSAGILIVTDSVFLIENNQLTDVNTSYWNSKGRMIRYVWEMLDPVKRVDDQLYTYNEKGQLTAFSNRTKTYYDNIEEEIITYNDHGEESGRKFFLDSELKNTLAFTYRYDEKGNWIEKHIFLNGVEDSVVKRSIRYK